MNVVKYWKEKTKLLENAFEGWQRKEEIQVRKLVIAKVMNIPTEDITYYLKRDNWYLKFALGDDSEVDRAFAEESSIKEKVQNIIEEYFYKKDYEVLCKIKEIFVNEVVDEKGKVCECIKALVEDDVYKDLSETNKETLDTFEKIYFYPIELFNEHIEEVVGSESYYSMLMEQWKTANEMAANISAQRNNMNNFYMSLMSILIGGVFLSNPLMDANLLIRTGFYIVIMFVGVKCCNKWVAQINNYGRLNSEKYEVINAIESKLPANVMLYEYLHTEHNARRKRVKIGFSDQEKEIAKLFRAAMIFVPVMMLLFSWGEFIWKMI